MDAIANWFSTWREGALAQLDALLGYLPELLGAIALVVLGWLVARLAQSVVQRFGNAINTLFGRLWAQGRLQRMRLSTGALQVAETVIYWLVILFFAAEAARIAGLAAFASWLDRIVNFVPSIIGGGVIILVGYILSTLVRDVVVASWPVGNSGEDAGMGPAAVNVPALLAQGATFLIAIVIGIDQVGINIEFLLTIIYIMIGGALLSLAVAFGLGARALVSNLIGAHDLRQHYALGQTVIFGAVHGEILEVTSTSVVVSTLDGRVTVPASVFHNQSTTLVVPPQ